MNKLSPSGKGLNLSHYFGIERRESNLPSRASRALKVGGLVPITKTIPRKDFRTYWIGKHGAQACH